MTHRIIRISGSGSLLCIKEKEKEQVKEESKPVEDNPLTELNKLYQSIRD